MDRIYNEGYSAHHFVPTSPAIWSDPGVYIYLLQQEHKVRFILGLSQCEILCVSLSSFMLFALKFQTKIAACSGTIIMETGLFFNHQKAKYMYITKMNVLYIGYFGKNGRNHKRSWIIKAHYRRMIEVSLFQLTLVILIFIFPHSLWIDNSEGVIVIKTEIISFTLFKVSL